MRHNDFRPLRSPNGSCERAGGRRTRTASYVLSGVLTALLAIDGVLNISNIAPVRESWAALGVPDHLNQRIGVILVILLLVYNWKPTAVLGAIGLSGYFGGAVATNLVHRQSLFDCVFPIAVSVALWTALYLRDPRVKALVPARNSLRE